jgi:hypothetical protein
MPEVLVYDVPMSFLQFLTLFQTLPYDPNLNLSTAKTPLFIRVQVHSSPGPNFITLTGFLWCRPKTIYLFSVPAWALSAEPGFESWTPAIFDDFRVLAIRRYPFETKNEELPLEYLIFGMHCKSFLHYCFALPLMLLITTSESQCHSPITSLPSLTPLASLL